MPGKQLAETLRQLAYAEVEARKWNRTVEALRFRRDKDTQEESAMRSELERIQVSLGTLPIGKRQTLLVKGSFKPLTERARELEEELREVPVRPPPNAVRGLGDF